MLKVIGAGLPRTATSSLREALPTLLGGECYHMAELFAHPEHASTWTAALRGEDPDWRDFFSGYTAAVDWPASAFWPELAEIYDDAIILLSTRTDASTWYRSMKDTIIKVRKDAIANGVDAEAPMSTEAFQQLWSRGLGEVDPEDAAGCEAAYDRHLQRVRDTAPADRLVEWDASLGWEPICEALGLAVPDEPFPHRNTTAEFLGMVGREAS